jgi:hypothetical protein
MAMAKTAKSETDQHTAALKAHTTALNKHTSALNALAATMPGQFNAMKLGELYHTGPCINGQQEVWVSDGAGGLQKQLRPC